MGGAENAHPTANGQICVWMDDWPENDYPIGEVKMDTSLLMPSRLLMATLKWRPQMAPVGAVLWSIVLLSGCENPSPTAERYENIVKVATATTQSMNDCYNSLLDNLKENSALDNITYAGGGDSNARKLALDRFASAPEKKDIIEFTKNEYECRAIAIEGYGKAHPLFAMAFIKYFAEADNIFAKLLTDELTYAEANKQFSEAFQKSMADSVNAYNVLTSELAASYAYEEKKRQEAIAALQNWIAVQQLLLNAQRSVAAAQPPRSFSYLHCAYAGPSNITCYPY